MWELQYSGVTVNNSVSVFLLDVNIFTQENICMLVVVPYSTVQGKNEVEMGFTCALLVFTILAAYSPPSLHLHVVCS